MKILAVGGGSGGHVTPVAAVLNEIGSKHLRAKLRFWTDKKFVGQAESIMTSRKVNAKISTIVSGKLRRYHHLSVIEHLMWPRLILLNTRDAFLVATGFIQSFVKLILWRPNIIFMKGGYVCMPVGFAARLLRIPFVLHDSDAHPGLTNRVLSRWAVKIATGAPLEYYDYPKSKAVYIGIPISNDFRPLTNDEKIKAKKEWGIDETKRLVVITGGGLGAARINEAVAEVLVELKEVASVVLISGTWQYDELRALTPPNSPTYQLHAFVSQGMSSLLGAADVVIARAGATTILELAALSMPTILVPNAKLTGGHQLKNAAVYKDAGAVEILDEEAMTQTPLLIVEKVKRLLDNPEEAKTMAKVFSKFSRPDAAQKMAELITDAIK